MGNRVIIAKIGSKRNDFAMKKFDGILLTTDLDGTLLKNDKSISQENLSAIEYFKQNGGKFTFITGRPSVVVNDLFSAVRPNAPIGCFNGGGIYDAERKEYLWTVELPREALELVENVDRVFPEMSIQICCFKNCYFCKMNPSLIKHLITANFPDLRCHYNEIDEPIAKVLFADESEENLFKLMDILKSHPRADEFDFIRSDPEFYEILPKGVSKGTLVLKLAELLGIDKNRTIAMGDNDNDASMLQSAALGIAVSNASPAAKAAANMITVSNEENAIAKIIDDIDKGKIVL